MSLKIGITESGDPSFDYSWVNKASDMDVLILITKNITDKFIEEILKVKHKTILHATCTGYGGTIVEPNVPEYTKQLDQVKKLISLGFPREQIVIRVDPIIPTRKGLGNLMKVVSYISADVSRFRVSVLDNYKHVQERFASHSLPVLYGGNFQASANEFADVDSVLRQLRNLHPEYGITFESCAEGMLKEAEAIGCVSAKDFGILGLPAPANELKGGRKGCLCIAGKTELLAHKTYGVCRKFKITDDFGGSCGVGDNCKTCAQHEVYGCPNQCLYCYWKS